MKRLNLIIWISGAALIAASIYFKSLAVTLSVAAGAVFITLCYHLLSYSISRAMREGGSKAFVVVISLAKFVVLGLVLWFVVTKIPINAVAFLAGLSTLVIAVAIYGLCAGVEKRT